MTSKAKSSEILGNVFQFLQLASEFKFSCSVNRVYKLVDFSTRLAYVVDLKINVNLNFDRFSIFHYLFCQTFLQLDFYFKVIKILKGMYLYIGEIQIIFDTTPKRNALSKLSLKITTFWPLTSIRLNLHLEMRDSNDETRGG